MPRAKQRGIVLILVLIGLVAMTLAGIALVRGSQTSSMIAGNFAFRQASLAAADTAVELAFAQLDTILAGLAEPPYPGGCVGGDVHLLPDPPDHRRQRRADGRRRLVAGAGERRQHVVPHAVRDRPALQRTLPIADQT